MPVTAPTSPEDPAEPSSSGPSTRISAGAARLTAIVAGILGIVLCALTPLLPVKAVDAGFEWPAGQELSADTSSVMAPLIAQTPQTLDARIPCATLASAPNGVVLATMPTNAPRSKSSSLWVTATDAAITVTFRNSVAATAARADLDRCRELRIFSAPTGPGAEFVGLGESTTLPPDRRPQVDGIFSALTPEQARAAAADGLRVQVTIDNRYESSPSVLKIVVMVLAALSVLIAVVALGLLDRIGGYHRRIGARTRSWWHSLKPRAADLVVTAILLVWSVLGAGSPDDGYILNMG
ncbi:arabinosyltransferase domain-containing protein, partial [Gordonia terrae]